MLPWLPGFCSTPQYGIAISSSLQLFTCIQVKTLPLLRGSKPATRLSHTVHSSSQAAPSALSLPTDSQPSLPLLQTDGAAVVPGAVADAPPGPNAIFPPPSSLQSSATQYTTPMPLGAALLISFPPPKLPQSDQPPGPPRISTLPANLPLTKPSNPAVAQSLPNPTVVQPKVTTFKVLRMQLESFTTFLFALPFLPVSPFHPTVCRACIRVFTY